MHELGIVVHIIDTLKEVSIENNVTKISEVTLEIGEVSGILENYLVSAWQWSIKKEPLLENAKLNIEKIHAITHCSTCNQNYDTVKHGKICPYCDSNDTYLITGDELNIKNIVAY